MCYNYSYVHVSILNKTCETIFQIRGRSCFRLNEIFPSLLQRLVSKLKPNGNVKNVHNYSQSIIFKEKLIKFPYAHLALKYTFTLFLFLLNTDRLQQTEDYVRGWQLEKG